MPKGMQPGVKIGVPPTSYLLYSLRYRLLTTYYLLQVERSSAYHPLVTCLLITLLSTHFVTDCVLLTTYYLLQVERSLAAMVMVVEQLVTHHPNP